MERLIDRPRLSIAPGGAERMREQAGFFVSRWRTMPETHPASAFDRNKHVMNLSHFVCYMSLLTFLGLKNAAAIDVGAGAPAVASVDETGQPVRFADYY